MYYWTFFVLIGNGRRTVVDQVKASDLRSACLQWAQVFEIDDEVWLSQQDRMTAWDLPEDLEHGYAYQTDLPSVWSFVCSFGVPDGHLPDEWRGEFPKVWIIKTDVRDRQLPLPGNFPDRH
jgi:hypothetical protein